MANTIDGYGAQFFPDQDIHAADLNGIQYTSIHALRNVIKHFTKTPGVLMMNTTDDNLRVTTNSDGSRFNIAPGTAIDSQGRIIYVPNDPSLVSGSIGQDPLYYPARPTRTDIDPAVSSAGIYYVNLNYDNITTLPKFDDAGLSHDTRSYDSYSISVDNTRTTDGITLASAQFDASGSFAITTDQNGYTSPISGTLFALFDDRIGHKLYDTQIGSNITDIAELQQALFDEELEKSVGFVYPADGHSIVTKINRDATLVRMELYMELLPSQTGTVAFDLFSGSVANEWKFGPESLQTSTANVFISKPLNNLRYFAHNPIKFALSQADDTVTRVTATLVYKRIR